MKVNLFAFVEETPDKYLQMKVEKNKQLYLPVDLVSTEKKNPKGGKDVCVRTNLPAYVNNESCADEGYTLISNGSRARGSRKENV